MIIGDFVRYVAPDDIGPEYSSREYSAIVTEVDPLDENAIGILILWPTYAFLAHRPLDGDPVQLDDSEPYAPDTWHPAP
jgi:hypothetical protein